MPDGRKESSLLKDRLGTNDDFVMRTTRLIASFALALENEIKWPFQTHGIPPIFVYCCYVAQIIYALLINDVKYIILYVDVQTKALFTLKTYLTIINESFRSLEEKGTQLLHCPINKVVVMMKGMITKLFSFSYIHNLAPPARLLTNCPV